MARNQKNTEILPLELRKLGLTGKEARVYLAALELGYASGRDISKKVEISRPTTYETIKSLERKGLINSSKEKGKKYFSAQSPDHLLGILKRQKRELEEKERELTRIISTLRSKYSLDSKKEIKIYQKKIGLNIVLEDFLTTNSKDIYVLASEEKIWPRKQREKAYQEIKKRLGEINVKEISITKEKLSPSYLKRKKINKNSFDFKGIIIIYDKVIIISPLKSYLLVENKILIDSIKSFFLLSWEKSTK